MRRKIIKQKTAYTITLPVNWVREHNLEGSDEIEINEEDSNLVLSVENKPSKDEPVLLHLEKGIDHYYRILIENQYLRGTDSLEIVFDDKNAFKVIREVVSNLIGFEIVSHEGNKCKIAETAMPTGQEFENILNRLIHTIKYLQEQTIESLEKNSFDSMKEFDELISDVRRFSLFCRRLVHKQQIVSRTDEVFLDLLLERLVIVGYEHFFLYSKLHNMKKDKGKIRKDVIELYKSSCAMFDLFSKMFFKKDISLFAKINSIWEEIYFKRGHNLSEKSTKKENIIIFHAINLSKVIFLVAQPNTVLSSKAMKK